MIQAIVQYLHDAGVPFRLASYPSQELEPKVAHHLPAGGMLVDTELVMLDGRLVLTCFPAGEMADLAAIGAALGGAAIEGTAGELPHEFRWAKRPIPPLGHLIGIPLVLDERLRQSSVLVFRAFGETDYFEVPYEDFARLEQPKIASFASAGELMRGRSA